MTKLREMKKKPSKLNSAEQLLLSKYLKPRPKSPEPKMEPEAEVPENPVSKEEDLSEPPITTPGPDNSEQQSTENVSLVNIIQF